MTIDRYIFQSPYSSQIQVGRPDLSANSKETGSNLPTEILKNPTETTQPAPQGVLVEKTEEISPTNSSNQLLNLYA